MVLEKDVLLAIRISSLLKESVDVTAKKSGLTSPEWIRAVLARAANEGAFAPRKGREHGKKIKPAR